MQSRYRMVRTLSLGWLAALVVAAAATGQPNRPAERSVPEIISEARVLIGQKDRQSLERALNMLRELEVAGQATAESWFLVAQTYENLGHPRTAEAYQRALQLAPDDEEVNYRSGLLHLRQGLNDLAMRDLQKARRINPNNPRIAAGLARAIANRDPRDVRARDLMAEAVRFEPSNPDFRQDFAQVLSARGDIELALAEFERSVDTQLMKVKTEPRNLEEYVRLQSFLGTLTQAYERAADAAPEPARRAELYRRIAAVTLRQAEVSYRQAMEARRVWALKAVEAMPEDAGHMLFYGEICLELGYLDEATGTLGRLTVLAPGDARVKAFERRLLELRTAAGLPEPVSPAP